MSAIGQHNLGGTFSSNSEYPIGFVSASRIALDPEQVRKTLDGNAIRPVRVLLPKTGVEPLDLTTQRLNAVVEVAPDVVGQTSSATLRGGLYGGVCGMIIGLASQGVGVIGDLFSKRPPAGLVVIGLFATAGAMIGSILGLVKSSRKNAKEVTSLLFQGNMQLPKAERYKPDRFEKY